MLESSVNTLYLTSSNSGEVMLGFKRTPKTDWSLVPKFKTVEEAFAQLSHHSLFKGDYNDVIPLQEVLSLVWSWSLRMILSRFYFIRLGG